MDLDLTPDQQAFRDEVRGWLQANVPREKLQPLSTQAGIDAHRAWEQRLYQAGYAAISWPTAYGGRDAPLIDNAIFQEEYALAGAPTRINSLGLGLAGPTLMVYGTDEQKARWLPGILSCEDLWSQGFSEPDAGSDLAALRTRAVREGDEYVINGQKIWTSMGRYADWMFTLVRTDVQAPKHRGISFVMIDMTSPGVEVRPIVQINGDAGFAEVFLTDVRVPVANLVGAENDGWRVAMTTLGFERGTGLGAHVRFQHDLDGLVVLAKAMGADDDPLVRDEIGRLHTEVQVYTRNMYRTLTTLTKGGQLGPEASVNKLFWSEMEVRLFDAGMRIAGPYAEITPKAEQSVGNQHPEAAGIWERWQHQYWYSRAACIYAGTTEIQKNIISERVLGLPKEAKA